MFHLKNCFFLVTACFLLAGIARAELSVEVEATYSSDHAIYSVCSKAQNELEEWLEDSSVTKCLYFSKKVGDCVKVTSYSLRCGYNARVIIDGLITKFKSRLR
jgi:hypothetical protein